MARSGKSKHGRHSDMPPRAGVSVCLSIVLGGPGSSYSACHSGVCFLLLAANATGREEAEGRLPPSPGGPSLGGRGMPRPVKYG